MGERGRGGLVVVSATAARGVRRARRVRGRIESSVARARRRRAARAVGTWGRDSRGGARGGARLARTCCANRLGFSASASSAASSSDVSAAASHRNARERPDEGGAPGLAADRRGAPPRRGAATDQNGRRRSALGARSADVACMARPRRRDVRGRGGSSRGARSQWRLEGTCANPVRRDDDEKQGQGRRKSRASHPRLMMSRTRGRGRLTLANSG